MFSEANQGKENLNENKNCFIIVIIIIQLTYDRKVYCFVVGKSSFVFRIIETFPVSKLQIFPVSW